MDPVRLDHVTINTAKLEESIKFYRRYLELEPRYRPDFGIGGAWLYPKYGDYAIVHLIVTEHSDGEGMFNHIAFRLKDIQAYLDKLKADQCWFEAMEVPGTPLTQVHHFDPNGIKIEVAFAEPLGRPKLTSAELGVTAKGKSVFEGAHPN